MEAGYVDESPPFATSENVVEASCSLNESLYLNGYLPEGNLQFDEILSSGPGAITELVSSLNVIHALIAQREEDLRAREKVSNALSRASCDKEQALENLRLEREKTRTLEEEKVSLTRQISTEKKQFELDRGKLTGQLRENKQKVMKLQRVVTQAEHEARKKERELNSLRERLRGSLREKDRSSATMSLSGPVNTDLPGIKTTMKATTAENEIKSWYETIVRSFEDQKTDLVSENLRLREKFASLEEEFREVLGMLHMKENADDEKEDTSDDIAIILRELPLDLVGEEFDKKMRSLLFEIRERVQTLWERDESERMTHVTGEGAEEVLKSRVQEYRRLIKQQDRVLSIAVQRLLSSSSVALSTSILINGMDSDEDDDETDVDRSNIWEQERRAIIDERAALQMERDRLIQEARALDEERRQLQREKENSREERERLRILSSLSRT